MFSLSHRYFEPFKALFSSLYLLKFLLLFLMFFSPASIAHCLEPSFAWDANTEPDLAGYKVFYRQEGQNYDYNNPAWYGTATTCTINGLDDNTTYYFVSRAYDIDGNESQNSVELAYEPEIIEDHDGGGISSTTSSSSGGGGCFIATAAFGSKFEKHVQILRQLRDGYLLPYRIGRAFINAYYKYSPPVADFIAVHDTLRALVRWSLLPLVGLSWMLLHLGVVPTLLLLVLMSSIMLACYGKIRFERRLTTNQNF